MHSLCRLQQILVHLPPLPLAMLERKWKWLRAVCAAFAAASRRAGYVYVLRMLLRGFNRLMAAAAAAAPAASATAHGIMINTHLGHEFRVGRAVSGLLNYLAEATSLRRRRRRSGLSRFPLRPRLWQELVLTVFAGLGAIESKRISGCNLPNCNSNLLSFFGLVLHRQRPAGSHKHNLSELRNIKLAHKVCYAIIYFRAKIINIWYMYNTYI